MTEYPESVQTIRRDWEDTLAVWWKQYGAMFSEGFIEYRDWVRRREALRLARWLEDDPDE